MTWFKVDDAFHSHPKVIGLSFAARGLWVTAGSWCGDHLTNGAVPKSALRVWGAAPKLADELVKAGLWKQTEMGWEFHDWARMNPTKEQVQAERDAAAERQKKHRTNKKQTPQSQRDTTDPSPSVTGPRPDPTRPDPKERETPAPVVAVIGPSGLAPAVAGIYTAERQKLLPGVPYESFHSDRSHWDSVARSVESAAKRAGEEPLEVARAVVLAYLSRKQLRSRAWPPKFLAEDIAELLLARSGDAGEPAEDAHDRAVREATAAVDEAMDRGAPADERRRLEDAERAAKRARRHARDAAS